MMLDSVPGKRPVHPFPGVGCPVLYPSSLITSSPPGYHLSLVPSALVTSAAARTQDAFLLSKRPHSQDKSGCRSEDEGKLLFLFKFLLSWALKALKAFLGSIQSRTDLRAGHRSREKGALGAHRALRSGILAQSPHQPQLQAESLSLVTTQFSEFISRPPYLWSCKQINLSEIAHFNFHLLSSNSRALFTRLSDRSSPQTLPCRCQVIILPTVLLEGCLSCSNKSWTIRS